MKKIERTIVCLCLLVVSLRAVGYAAEGAGYVAPRTYSGPGGGQPAWAMKIGPDTWASGEGAIPAWAETAHQTHKENGGR